jgi:hypothetical protein
LQLGKFRGVGDHLRIDTAGLAKDDTREQALKECPCPNKDIKGPAITKWGEAFVRAYQRIEKGGSA